MNEIISQLVKKTLENVAAKKVISVLKSFKNFFLLYPTRKREKATLLFKSGI